MVDFKSKIFFIVFFGMIVISVFVTFNKIMIEKDFKSFSEEDQIPRASDFYINFLESNESM